MENKAINSRRIIGNVETNPELFSLNLIYDYPVSWSKFKVLRDFMQNFYDALGWKNWDSRFGCELIKGELLLTARDAGFSFDWLLHIGASTKRESRGSYAGYFGEGFKIASLCAVRDYDWSVKITSRDWTLAVVTTDLKVDERCLKSLAYKIWRSRNYIKDTVLSLSPFHDEGLLKTVLLSFYYPSNPLFGKEIWVSSEAAVYFRSAQQKPEGYPTTYGDNGRGVVFAGYQALGSFQFPLIFCLHNFRYDDRERNSFYRMDVIDLIRKVVSKLSPETSSIVLQVLKRRWYDRPRKKYDFESWCGIISVLVNNVANSLEEKRVWREKNPHLLVAQQVRRNDVSQYNRRRQALDWLKHSGRHYRLVQDAFLALNYFTLEQACEQADGFSVTREPNADERMRIQILEQLVLHLLPDLFKYIELPPCKVIKSEKAVWQGMATCIPMKDHHLDFRGLAIRYRLSHVALKQGLLHSQEFGNVLSTYLHELAHMFGGDGSVSFSHVLTELMEIILSSVHLIVEYQELWTETPIPVQKKGKGSSQKGL